MDCKNCEDKQACVPFFVHENTMMHKDRDSRRMFCIIIALCFVIVAMVAYYTSRTQMWNDTIRKQNETIIMLLNDRPSATEVTNGVHQQSNP